MRAMTGVGPNEEKMVTRAALARMGADQILVKTLTTTPLIRRKLTPVTQRDIASNFKES